MKKLKCFKSMSLLNSVKWAFAIIIMLNQMNGYSQCNTLVWADEFDQATIDAAKWNHEVNGDGGGNGEEQYYTDRAQNSYIEDGKLIIKLLRENYGGKPFTSARLNSRYKASWTYGRVEVMAKVPGGVGTWPAIWMLPDDQSAGWPDEGEIDIMEHVGYDPTRVHGTVHTAAFNHMIGTQVGASTIVDDYNTAFHLYAVEWTPNEIRWYVDDNHYHTFTNQGGTDKWPFDKPFHLILNVAVGGAWGGVEGIDPNLNEAQMEIEYCRVYSGTFTNGVSGDTKVYENETNKVYSIDAIDGASYTWSVPTGATITSGQGSNSIVVDYGTTEGSVSVEVAVAGCETNTYTLDVAMEPPVTLEYVFEDFESNRNLNYTLFSGSLTQTIANPNPALPNPSASVGQYTRNADEEYDVLFAETGNIGNAIDFVSGKRRIQMEVYTAAPKGTKIVMQFENSATSQSTNYPTGRHSVYEAYTTVQNQWETIEFEFTSRPDGSVGAFDCDNMVFLIEPGTYSNHSMYFDNIRSVIAPDKEIISTVVIADYDGIYNMDTIFANGIYNANMVNPEPNEVNGSAHAASYQRNAGDLYDVISFGTSAIENAAYFKSGEYILFADVYTAAPIGTEIAVSFENEAISAGDYPYGRNSQYSAVTTVQNQWETLQFVYVSSPDAGTSNLEIDELTFLFNPNSNSSDVYYIDNIRYGTTVVPPSYEFDYMIHDYETNNNLTLNMATGNYVAPIATPNPNDVNSSALSGEYTRSIEDLYDVIFLGIDVIDDASVYENEEKRFALDVYTDAPAGTVISWQLENSAMSTGDYPAGRHSVYQATTKEEFAWHTLEFSYSSSPDVATPDHSIDQMVLLVNPNSETDHTYYFDNFRSLKQTTVVVNNPPVANAGADQVLPAETTSTSLDGSHSSDPDGDVITYAWTQISGPNAAVFSSTTVSSPSVSGLITGQYTFELTVDDGEFNDSDQVVITIEAPVNNSPIANAGADQVLPEGTTIASLDGSASSDPDGDAITYNWSQIDGPNTANFNSVIIAEPSITGLIAGSYTFELQVSDGQLSDTNRVVITIEDGGFAFAIPGIIQAEDWNDMYGVQTEPTTDIGGGLNVGWIDAGDWLDYNVNVNADGNYLLKFRGATPNGPDACQVLIDGAEVGIVDISTTGSWQTWETFETTVALTAGVHTLRLYAQTTQFNINWVEFIAIETPVLTTIDLSPQNISIDEGATQQFTAVGYDQFGDEIAFVATWIGTDANGLFTETTPDMYTVSVESGNVSASTTITVNPVTVTCTRYEAENWANMFGVQTEATTDEGGGLNVGWINTNDWIDINVFVNTPGDYTLKLRGATPNGPDVCQVQVDYVVAGQIDIATTGSWQTWETFETTINIATAGNHVIRLLAVTNEFNINWIELCGPNGTPNNAPVASFTANPISGTVPLTVSFDASASSDEDGDALTYSWDFGDGATATGVIVEHTYNTEGSYIATLTVSDGSLSDYDATTITVEPQATNCAVDAANGDFSVEVSTDANSPTLTFIPSVAGIGDNLLLLYYGTNPNGPYPAYMPTPNEPYQINAAAGETVYFYYTYSLPTGGENNSSANKNSFVVGQCATTLKTAATVTNIADNMSNVKAYPNPVSSMLTIDFGEESFNEVSIVGLAGQIVAKQLVNNNPSLEFNFDHLSKGMYMVILSSQTKRKVIKVTKQ